MTNMWQTGQLNTGWKHTNTSPSN